MHVSVNGVRLFFDVEGAKFSPTTRWCGMPIPDLARGTISRLEVALHWFANSESDTFNLFPDLGRIRCPTLVIGGEDDPMHPIESQADLAAALPPNLVQFERFTGCGHGVVPDAPEQAMALLQEFILRR